MVFIVLILTNVGVDPDFIGASAGFDQKYSDVKDVTASFAYSRLDYSIANSFKLKLVNYYSH